MRESRLKNAPHMALELIMAEASRGKAGEVGLIPPPAFLFLASFVARARIMHKWSKHFPANLVEQLSYFLGPSSVQIVQNLGRAESRTSTEPLLWNPMTY